MGLNAKTPYMDTNYRTKELQPTIGFASRESAVAFLNQTLNDYRLRPSYSPEDMQTLAHLQTEILLEIIRQTGNSIDFRGVSFYQQAIQKSLSEQKQAVYNGEVIKAWETVKQNYNQKGRLLIDLGDLTVEPVLLGLHDEKPVLDWACEPTDSLGVARCFDIREEKYSLKTWKDTAKMGISVGHLHAFNWQMEIYSRAPEPVYQSFRQWVELRLAEFEQEHGGLTPIVVVKQSNVIKQVVGGDTFLVGWRITVKSLAEQAQPQPKQSKLSKIINRLPLP